MDKSIIPKGYYCYSGREEKRVICPYWKIDPKHPDLDQENGYCEFLGKGDWDFNEEGGKIRVYDKTGKMIGTEPAHSESMSWLWDQVKACGVNKPNVLV